VIAAIGASIVFHLAMWPVGNRVVAWGSGGQPLPTSSGIMEVSLLPPAPVEKPEEELSEEDRPQLDSDKKLVKLDSLEEQERPPEDTNYVSEFDSRVDKETRAPKRRPRPGAVTPPTGDRPDGKQGQSDRSSEARRPNASQALPLGGRSSSNDGEGRDADRSEAEPADDGTMSNDAGKAAANLSPRGVQGLDGLRKQWGTPGSYDDLDDIEEGDGTFLNSRRWKFASFFNRVRDQVAEHWHPEVLHASNDPDSRKYGTKTRRTKLMISLNSDGSLHRIRLERSSDVDYLDEEAIRAVRAAQPFANPPPGLVNPETGHIDFGFAFIFEINGGTRIFRYRK
jgi:TonB family protein